MAPNRVLFLSSMVVSCIPTSLVVNAGLASAALREPIGSVRAERAHLPAAECSAPLLLTGAVAAGVRPQLAAGTLGGRGCPPPATASYH